MKLSWKNWKQGYDLWLLGCFWSDGLAPQSIMISFMTKRSTTWADLRKGFMNYSTELDTQNKPTNLKVEEILISLYKH